MAVIKPQAVRRFLETTTLAALQDSSAAHKKLSYSTPATPPRTFAAVAPAMMSGGGASPSSSFHLPSGSTSASDASSSFQVRHLRALTSLVV